MDTITSVMKPGITALNEENDREKNPVRGSSTMIKGMMCQFFGEKLRMPAVSPVLMMPLRVDMHDARDFNDVKKAHAEQEKYYEQYRSRSHEKLLKIIGADIVHSGEL